MAIFDTMKQFIKIFAGISLGLFFMSGVSAQELRVIPMPAQTEMTAQTYSLRNKPVIGIDSDDLSGEYSYLAEQLRRVGYRTTMARNAKTKRDIVLCIAPELKGKEEYRLTISAQGIVIRGGSPAGVFYGVGTLLQMVENNDLKIGEIHDAPRYAWRGYMLDEARHFSGEKRVKELLDLMARFKLNRFHWHLTDAQGWRIEIKRYPRLATIGGRGNHSNPNEQLAKYYTQEQIRDIVAYAAERHIEIIPEIDMPGHATAANRAYTEYSGGGSKEFPDFTFNVGKEETYEYLTNILREVRDLFPSKWMHIGGDEVAYGIEAWETDPHVQALLKREGLKNVKEAERYFMHRMTDTVAALGKTLIGWDELMDLNVKQESSVIMWWRHDRPNYLHKALDNNYTTVICPRKPLYFDFVQHSSHNVGRIWDGFCPLEDVYAFPDKWFEMWNVNEERQHHIIGMQANVWSELMHTKQRVDFMTFPRLCALAEAAWTNPERKSYENFTLRMEDVYRLFDDMGIYYFDPRNPNHHPEPAGPVILKSKQTKMDFRD